MISSENSVELFELDKRYSTTRRVSKKKPFIANSPESKIKTQLSLSPKLDRKGEGGLRTQEYFKHCAENKPVVSIITVVFNGAETLEQTIQSVINQSYDNIEYIIIDGGSTDGTIEIIKKYDKKIDYWVSEPDAGIYQAMNKGTSLATGDWLLYMNADDWFYRPGILKKIYDNKTYEADVLIGDFVIIYPELEKPAKAGGVENLWKEMQFCHQSIFFSKKIMLEYGYETHFDIAADFNLLYQILVKRGVKYNYLNEIVAAYRMGGLSDKNILKGYKECSKVVLSHRGDIKTNLYLRYKLVNILLRLQFKKLIPLSILTALRKIK